MFDKSKMPPGLLKELPDKANGNAKDARAAALQRRLDQKNGGQTANNKRIRIG